MRRWLRPRLIGAIALAVAGFGGGAPLGHAATTTTASANYDYDPLVAFPQRGDRSPLRSFASPVPLTAGEGALAPLGFVTRAGVAAKGAPGLGDLTRAEIRQIQGVVDRAGRPLEVVGSAARGQRRGVGSNLPIGKGAGTRSDIDYLVPPSSGPYYRGLEGGLPSLDPHGVIPGFHNPFVGPGIRFEPGAPPSFLPPAP